MFPFFFGNFGTDRPSHFSRPLRVYSFQMADLELPYLFWFCLHSPRTTLKVINFRESWAFHCSRTIVFCYRTIEFAKLMVAKINNLKV